MPQLLLELFSEEIPARMQAQAGRDLERMARERLTAAELAVEGLRAYAGPRRLTLVVDGLPTAQADRTEERKGPRANAPDQALQGFLRSTGLTREELVERDGVLFATLHRAGRPTPQIVAEMVEAIVRNFPWPKSMRWGSGQLRWVRPLQRILCVFDGEIVPFAIDGIESGDLSEGHRFMGGERAPFAARDFDTYARTLAERFVVLDPAERRARIAAGAQQVCAAKGLEWVQDEGLLDEVTGLAEWPVPILGDMDPDFLDLPAEVIRTSMRTHQRYFAVRDPKTGGPNTGKLAPHFVVTANIEPTDGGAVIAHGNARVLTARLSDARFFWDEDRRGGNFERWAKKLNGVTFHAKLGTMAQRVERITALAKEIAPLVGADVRLTEIAAKLCKADLASGMVGEFPELQGIMGGYYARQPSPAEAKAEAAVADLHATADGSEDPLATIDQIVEASADHHWSHGLTQSEIDIVADAVRDHYKPIGPSDTVPTAPVTVAVALADKLDTLVGFFGISEKPTGSRDPYALRRAALGVIRLALGTKSRLALREVFKAAEAVFVGSGRTDESADLLAFFADRLKVSLRDEGKRHDLVDAVFAPINGKADDDLVRIVARVEALDGFLHTEDGASLLAGYRRAANILKAEAKKAPGEDYALNWDLDLLAAPEEQALSAALRTVLGEVDRALDGEDFEGAMRFLSHLRTPVDAFFDKVLVNDSDPAVRLNRLRLLSAVRDTANRVADFSLVSNA
jgi:glycyl-tRNA synthetase beta chain